MASFLGWFVEKSYLRKVTEGIFLIPYRSKVISKKVSHGSFPSFTLTGLRVRFKVMARVRIGVRVEVSEPFFVNHLSLPSFR